MNKKILEYAFLFLMCNVIALSATFGGNKALYILGAGMLTITVVLLISINVLDRRLNKKY